MGHQRSKLSVVGAMKDIQDYKIMKAKADMAPTLVERAKLELEWDKEDRPDDLKLKKQSIKKGEQDIVAKERESLLNYYNDSASMAQWVLEGETEEEQRKRYDVAKRMIISSHEDHVTSAGPGGKPGDLMPEFDIEGIKTVASLAAEKARKLQAVDPTKDIVDMGTGEIVREGEPKPEKGPYKEGEIKDFKEGDQFVQKKYTGGKWVPTGVKAPRYKPGVTINMPDTVTPSMKTKLQTEMFERQQAIDRLNQIEELTKDEYLTYWGKGKAKVSEMAAKAGIATDKISDYAADYEEWATSTKAHTLLWRKLITGVAGGEKEMEAIEAVSINIGDSAKTFRRKLRRQKAMAEVAKQRAQYSIENFGISIKDLSDTKKAEIAKKFPGIIALDEQSADDLLKELGYE